MQQWLPLAGRLIQAAFAKTGENVANNTNVMSSLGGAFSGGGTGWMNQTGGFDGLSSEEQEEARQAHAGWQEHTFDGYKIKGVVNCDQVRELA